MARRYPIVWGALFCDGLCRGFADRSCDPDRRGSQATPSGKPAAAIAASDISLDQAHVALEAAMKKAVETKTRWTRRRRCRREISKPRRMDAPGAARSISPSKRPNRAIFRHADRRDRKLSQPGGPLYQIEVSNGA